MKANIVLRSIVRRGLAVNYNLSDILTLRVIINTSLFFLCKDPNSSGDKVLELIGIYD